MKKDKKLKEQEGEQEGFTVQQRAAGLAISLAQLYQEDIYKSPAAITFNAGEPGATFFAIEKAINTWNAICVENIATQSNRIILLCRDPGVINQDEEFLKRLRIHSLTSRYSEDIFTSSGREGKSRDNNDLSLKKNRNTISSISKGKDNNTISKLSSRQNSNKEIKLSKRDFGLEHKTGSLSLNKNSTSTRLNINPSIKREDEQIANPKRSMDISNNNTQTNMIKVNRRKYYPNRQVDNFTNKSLNMQDLRSKNGNSTPTNSTSITYSSKLKDQKKLSHSAKKFNTIKK